MRFEEVRDQRADVDAPEGDGRADDKAARRRRELGLRRALRFLSLGENAFDAFEVARAGVGHGDRACRAPEQRDAEMILEASDQPRHRRRRHFQVPRR